MGLFSAIGKGVKSIGNGIKSVGKAVGDTVMGLGETACRVVGGTVKGAATLITDPGKFVSDVGNNIQNWGENVKEGWQHGWDIVKTGADQLSEGAFLPGLGKIIAGVPYAVSAGGLGTTEMIADTIRENADITFDEMGNMTMSAKEDAHWLEKQLVNLVDKPTSNIYNSEKEIQEAIDEGDIKKANSIAGKQVLSVAGKVVGTAGAVVGTVGAVASVVAIPFTGGGSSALAPVFSAIGSAGTIMAAGGAVTGLVGNGVHNVVQNSLDNANLADDVSNMVKSEVQGLMDSGALSKENAEEYGKYLEQYLNTASYMCTNTSDRETFNYVIEANHLLNPTTGVDIPSEDLKAVTDAFTEAYQQNVNDGLLTQDQAKALTDLGVYYTLSGQMDDATYYSSMYAIQTANLEMSDEQRNSYVAHLTNYTLGAYDDTQFQNAVYSDPSLQCFIKQDGSFEIPMKEAEDHYYTGSLTNSISEQDMNYANEMSSNQCAVEVQQERGEKEIFQDLADTYGFA